MYIHLSFNARRIYREEMLGRSLMRADVCLDTEKFSPAALDEYKSFIRGRGSLLPLSNECNELSASSPSTTGLTFEDIHPDSPDMDATVDQINRLESIRKYRCQQMTSLLQEYGIGFVNVQELKLTDSIITAQDPLDQAEELIIEVFSE